MQLPWIKRSEHERIVAASEGWLARDHDIIVGLMDDITDLRGEIARLRSTLLAEQNAHAVARGRLITEAHGLGQACD